LPFHVVAVKILSPKTKYLRFEFLVVWFVQKKDQDANQLRVLPPRDSARAMQRRRQA